MVRVSASVTRQNKLYDRRVGTCLFHDRDRRCVLSADVRSLRVIYRRETRFNRYASTLTGVRFSDSGLL